MEKITQRGTSWGREWIVRNSWNIPWVQDTSDTIRTLISRTYAWISLLCLWSVAAAGFQFPFDVLFALC